MSRRISMVGAVLTVLAAVCVLALASVPASAHHKDGHAQGSSSGSEDSEDKAKGSSGKDDDGDGYTEDNDTNDGGTPNNVPDDGDNAHPSGKDRSVENGGSGNQGKSPSDPDGDANGGPDKPNGSGGVDLADQDGNNGCGNDDDFEDDNNGNCGGKPKAPRAPKAPKPPRVAAAGPCPEGGAMGAKSCDEAPETPCVADAGMAADETCAPVDASPAQPAPCVEDAAMTGAAEEECDLDGDVLGEIFPRPETPEAPGPDLEVLGERLAQGSSEEPAAVEAARRAAGFLGQVLPFTGAGLVTLFGIAAGLLLVGGGLLKLRRRSS